MKTSYLIGIVLELLIFGCTTTTNEWKSQSGPQPTQAQLEDVAINSTLNDICGFTNMTVRQAIGVDGVRHVGGIYGPLKVGAFKQQWESPSDSSLKADGYEVIVTYTGTEGEVKYLFHWDGDVVRYMNPAAMRALNACE